MPKWIFQKIRGDQQRVWVAAVFNLLFYQDYEDSDRMDRYVRDGVNHLFRGKRTNHLLRGRRSTSGAEKVDQSDLAFRRLLSNVG